ncbi:alpha/beta hydrolase [candidate division WOR-3 bacterium]|nr:alpha/beta hydrolase [candidate division WOR-3 bacterium]
MKRFSVFLPVILALSCSKGVPSRTSGLKPQSIYNISVDNNQVGFEKVQRTVNGDTTILTSVQERPFRLRPIVYDSKLVLVSGFSSRQISTYRCFEQLPGQRISFRLKFEKPWIVLLHNSVVSSPRYYNSDPKDPDGPAVIEWDKAFLIEALVGRYSLKDTLFERVQEVPVLIPSAFGEWGGAVIELTRLKNDTAEFRIVYTREIQRDSMLFWADDSVYAVVRTITGGPNETGRLLQARVVLPTGISLSIFEDEQAPLTMQNPLIFTPEKENYSIEDVSFEGADRVILSGSFYVPEGKEVFPAILFLQASAASDRNQMGIFSSLAAKIASSGTAAVLIYDKRGAGESGGSYDSLHWGILASDAASAFEVLWADPRVDRHKIFILGHGEGALISFDLASDMNFKDRIKGVLSLGATSLNPVDSGNIEMLILQAIERDWSSERLEKQINDLKAGLDNLRNTDAYWADIPGFGGERENLAYARSLLDFDPLSKIKASSCHFLILHGEDDRFVSPRNAEVLFDVCRQRDLEKDLSKYLILEGVDANFAFPTIEGKDGFREYFKLPEDAGKEISLSGIIIEWIGEVVTSSEQHYTQED